MTIGTPQAGPQAAAGHRLGRSLKAVRGARAMRLLVLAWPLWLAACGGGGGAGSGSADGSSGGGNTVVTPTSFAGLVLALANSPATATVAWQAASGGSTPAAQLQYAVHVATTDGFTPSAATLAKTVTGTTSTTLSGLAAGTTYYVQVVALNSAGQATPASGPALSLHTPSSAPLMSSSTPLLAAGDLKLPAPVRSGNTLSFATTGGETAPPVGAVLVGTDSSGAPYLLTVQSVAAAGGSLTLQTSQAQLSDAVLAGAIDTRSVLFGSPLAQASASSGNPNLQRTAAASRTAADGSGTRIDWPNGLLRFEELPPSGLPEGSSVSRNPSTGRYTLASRQLQRSLNAPATAANGLVQRQALTGSASDEMNFDIGLDFAPQLTTTATWTTGLSGLQLQSAVLAASGTLSLDAKALYKFAAAGSYSTTQTLDVFTRSYTSTYLVGSVPVYQEVKFTLTASVQAKADSALEATADANLAQTVSFGVRYNAATEAWEPFNELPGPRSALTASFKLKGGASATLTLQPKVEVKFYSMVTGSLSLQPMVTSAMAAEAVQNLDLLAGLFPAGTTQLTTFDVSAGAKCYVGASLEFLSRRIRLMSPTEVCSVPATTLFSLPTLALKASHAAGYSTLTATITDGQNDPFDDASLRWSVAPASAGSVTGGIARQVQFNFAPGARTATVFVSGNGVLGEVGRQFAQLTLQAPPATTVAPSATVDEQSTDGSAALSVTVDGEGTGYWLVSDSSSASAITAAQLVSSGRPVALHAGTASRLSLSGLTGGRIYTAWFVAASATGNLPTSLQSVSFTMPMRYLQAAGLTWAPVDRVNATSGGAALLATTQREAADLCAAGSWRGLSGWRLPTLTELRALGASAPLVAAGWAGINLWASDAVTDLGIDGFPYPANPVLGIAADGQTTSFNARTGNNALSACVHP